MKLANFSKKNNKYSRLFGDARQSLPLYPHTAHGIALSETLELFSLNFKPRSAVKPNIKPLRELCVLRGLTDFFYFQLRSPPRHRRASGRARREKIIMTLS